VVLRRNVYCHLSLSCRFAYGSVWETQIIVLSGDGLCLVPRPVWKKCLSQSRGSFGVISLYGQGVLEKFDIVFEGTRRLSAVVLVWEHKSPAYGGAPGSSIF
jgi:hypothetical protein